MVRTCILMLIVLVLAACNPPAEVSVVSPRRGTIDESFQEPARTRLAHDFPITLPIEGRIARITFEPGDRVTEGQLLVEYDLVPLQQAVAEARAAVKELEASIAVLDDDQLEQTALVETRAVVQATEEAIKAADEQVAAQEARLERAQKELKRVQELTVHGVQEERALDDAGLAAETALIDMRQEEFNRAAMRAMMIAVQTGPRFVMDWLNRESLQRAEAVSRLEQAQARLALAEHRLELAEVRSPINGIVLERMERGGQALPAGHLVMLVGDLAEMEVIADVLTQDALKLSEGSPVELTLASEPKALQGRVQRVEPQAFTKLSSLGVEQQRVNAIVTLEERPENLGVGYRVQARFLTGTSENALIVPRFSVLQDEEGTYYVFRVIDGKLSRTAVKLGLTSDLEMEVTEGLGEGDTIVRAPEATMKDGQAVSVRD